MTILRRRLLQAGLFGPTLTFAQTLAQTPTTKDSETSGLQRLLDERLRHEGVGLAAARLLADGTAQLNAAGRSGRGQDLLTPDAHLLEIGSITKTFIGLLLADAVVRGELKLDDPAETLLPEGLLLRDSEGQPLRLVDLATHRSGLPRLPTGFAPKDPQDPYADFGDADMLVALRAFKPQRRRDEAFEYSNWGMGLLAWLLARRAGQPLGELLQARVLAPLGVGGAGGMRLQQTPLEGASIAQGHDATGKSVPAWHFQDALAGAGALRASATQLARYAQAVLGLREHPLGKAMALALQVHSELGPQKGTRMGLAWMLLERGGQRLATHDGGTFGFSSSLWLNLSERTGGLVLANAHVGVTDLAAHLMDARARMRDLTGERRAKEQPVQALAAAQLAPLAGVYALSPKFKITVRAEGERLFAQATGQGEFELFAKAARQFFARVAPLEVHFDGEDGPPPAFTLRQAGQTLRFLRE